MLRIFSTILIFSVTCRLFSQLGIMSSQIGYDSGDQNRIIIRSDNCSYLTPSATFSLTDADENIVYSGKVQPWGMKWGSYWWIADFTAYDKNGIYQVIVRDRNLSLKGDPVVIGNNILWSKCFHVMAFDNLNTRSQQARTGKGWKDCGSDLQEFSSHVVTIDALCDILETGAGIISAEEKILLEKQILKGSDYLVHLQDKAKLLGLGDGSVIHEDRQTDVVTGNVAKAAMIFARMSRMLNKNYPDLSLDFIDRSKRAFQWIEKNGPVVNAEEQLFYASVHGAPAGSVPPKDQWMTQDLLMMLRASVELYRAGESSYKSKAVSYADHIIKRQVPQSENEDGLYGHFYTYDNYASFGGVKFTEKADIHCGAWSKEGRIYNKGGHYPHYLIPVIDMIKLWPDHKDTKRWRKMLSDFAYGYFLPACKRSPFLILPAGYYRNEGLLFFQSWYHAHNKIYALSASQALEFGKFFGDTAFRAIAVGNLQWIAGLNCGLKDDETSGFLPVSMISGIGLRSKGSWTGIPGSVCNGFSAGKQFRIKPASATNDKPVYFNDEDYIAHTLPYVAALSRLVAYKQNL